MTQSDDAVLELNDNVWSAICERVPSALTKTKRSRVFVSSIVRMMTKNLTWAGATPEQFGDTTLYSTVNAWAYKDVIGPLVEVLDQQGLTKNWNLSEIEPAIPNKRPQLKQFIGLKLLELKGLHPPVFYTKDWGTAGEGPDKEFVITPEIKARNAKLRSKLRKRRKRISEGAATNDRNASNEPGLPGVLKIAA